ncbi:STAS/SEC14 domain-containing protein [Jannaschia sp. W003]|uniref:STAS/SEC14 domain-containing protein n=1 Tax=Jannaschia sp. W003 TaxID=2867012 RepID=UPI0021A4F1DD|nr:STAS/SEC14 domain-containing protein [Jannaschia sp. W003]UWQ20070.1 STAS/SEC14 domain-containing protein [Jannaschia sp. W003]
MLTVTKPSADRVDIELRGALDADAMRQGLDALIAASDGVRNGRMLYTITDFAMPTFGAIGVEMGRLPKLFGLLGKFRRCAVLADADWLQRVAEAEGALFPGIDIKAFDLDERDEAEAWLARD